MKAENIFGCSLFSENENEVTLSKLIHPFESANKQGKNKFELFHYFLINEFPSEQFKTFLNKKKFERILQE